MEKVERILRQLQVDFISYHRIKDESFASEVYFVETTEKPKILKFGHSKIKFWRELRTLEFLRGQVPVPELISSLPPDTEINGVMLMEKVPGKPIARTELEPILVEKCGALLGKLHSIPVSSIGDFEESGFTTVPFSKWWEYRKDLVMGAWTKTIESKVGDDFLERSKRFLENFYAGQSATENCFVHCDYRPGNVLHENGTPTAVIDFESARTGDPAYDFIKFHEVMGHDPNLWNAFLNGYKSITTLPELSQTLNYYEFELNYGFLQWATARSDHQLFEERYALSKSLLEKFEKL